MRSLVENIILSCPITALKFLQHVVLAGEGPFLIVYNVENSQEIQRTQIFVDAAIHGIREVPNDNEENAAIICVFGSKQLRVGQLDCESGKVTFITGVVYLTDWIWDVVWLSHAEERKGLFVDLACVLAHNSIQYVEIRGKSTAIKREVHCEEKCIIYCARCFGRHWDELVVASGTVFNQVVLWRPSRCQFSEELQRYQSKVMHRLTGHEGVIFSMDYHPDKQLLASVSDDRSIRLWGNRAAVEPGTTRDSGVVPSESVVFEECRVLYGHKARVWDVRLLADYIISVGEDSACCVWTYSGNLVIKYKGHKGKSIWSLAVAEDQTTMVTGGGDCSLRQWSLSQCDVGHSLHTTPLHIPHVQSADFPRLVQLQDDNHVVTVTNDGVLWSYTCSSDKWEIIDKDENFKSYSVLTCYKYTDNIAMGNIQGVLKIYSTDVTIEQMVYDGKVLSLLWLDRDDQLLTTGPHGSIDVWHVSYSNKCLSKTGCYELPYTRQRWVSAAVMVPHWGVMVCGDRGGSLHVYSLNSQELQPVQSFWKLHGKTGVTDLCYHGDRLYSVGRDGQYRMYSYHGDRLSLLSSHKVYKGFEWIAQLLVQHEDILALGFHTDEFVVFSTSTNQKLVSIPCGGGHRAWDFLFSAKGKHQGAEESFKYVFIKKGDVVICEGDMTSNHKVIQEGLHDRELCDVLHLQSEGSVDIVVTASEDTDVNIMAVSHSEHHTALQKLDTLQGHLSSVRALCVSNPTVAQPAHQTRTSRLLFSGGGRAEIKAWRIYTEFDSPIQSEEPNAKTSVDKEKDMGDNNSERVNSDTQNSSERVNSDTQNSSERVNSDIQNSGERVNSDIQNSVERVHSDTQNSGERVHSDTQNSGERVKCWHEYLCTHSLYHKSKHGYKPWKQKECDPDPETRYMDLATFNVGCLYRDQSSHESDQQHERLSLHNDLHIVVAACSDGFVRLLGFNGDSRQFSTLAECSYHDHCVLKVDCIVRDGCVYVLSAATDGRVAVWNVSGVVEAYVSHQRVTDSGTRVLAGSNTLVDMVDLGQVIQLSIPVMVADVHQSGVNSLHVCLLSEDDWLVATGGDDNAITVTEIHRTVMNDQETFTVTRQGQRPAAHTTQVTGLKWLDQRTLLSVSIDQRLVTWHVKDDLQLEICGCRFTGVADVANMTVWQKRPSVYGVGICGVGLQCLQLKLLEDS